MEESFGGIERLDFAVMAASAYPAGDYDCSPRDSVDDLLTSWAQRRPDLGSEFEQVAVITRLLRLRGHVEAGLHSFFRGYDLSPPDFTALVTLARVSDDHGVSQQRLAEELGLTPGTVSVRIDRLVAQGLAERRPDPASKRSTLVVLTPAGRKLFERIIPAHLANEERMLAALSDQERDLLSGLLRKLIVEFEGSRPADGRARLGLVLAPAPVTITMRAAVGLPGVAGLLVRSVEPGSPAARAGLRPGDVLTAAGARELRSSASLYAALRDAGASDAGGRGAGPVRLTVLRGTDQLTVSLELGEAAGLPLAVASRSAGPPEHIL